MGISEEGFSGEDSTEAKFELLKQYIQRVRETQEIEDEVINSLITETNCENLMFPIS